VPPSPPGEAEAGRFEGQLEFNKKIPVELSVGKSGHYYAVNAKTVRFERSEDELRAGLQVDLVTVLTAKWLAKLEFLTAGGRVLQHSEAVFSTTRSIKGVPKVFKGFLNFRCVPAKDLAKASKFRIGIGRAPEDAKVTADLRRETKPPEKADISPSELAAEAARLNVSQARVH
jgi:hypothetical protein